MEETSPWIVIVRGEAEGMEQRVAIDFEDTELIFGSEGYAVSRNFVKRLLLLVRQNKHFVIKTIIEDVRTPETTKVPLKTPLFALLSRSQRRGLSAGALFIAPEESSFVESPSTPALSETSSFRAGAAERYNLVGLSPIGFAAACADDVRLFARFLARLLKHPESFSDVSLILPRSAAKLD
jgi:hypothetical protein